MVMTLLEMLNGKVSLDLRKDPTKEYKFMESKYSPVADLVKKDERVVGKDVLALVQTNLIKLYVSLKERDRLYNFFNDNQNALGYQCDSDDLEEYMKRGGAISSQDTINTVAMALIYEFTQQYS